MPWFQFFQVLLLGALCGMIPGPVITAVFTQAINKGWLASRRTVLLAGAGEFILSLICIGALSFIDPKSVVFPALSLFGALVLLSLCVDLWRTEEIHEREPLFSNQRMILIALGNAMAWIFYITVCAPFAIRLEQKITGGKWIFAVLFQIGWFGSTMLLCYCFELFRAFFQSNRKMHLLFRTVALVFLIFAVKLAIVSSRALLA
jgi:threonine/homoserine/homoserine lactone efflux protein